MLTKGNRVDFPINFILNNEEIHADVSPTTILLDFIRKHKRLTGTKEGCREGDCGACTVLFGEIINGKINYKTINSCLVPVEAVVGKHIITIEGINTEKLNLIQQTIVDEGATQCGFCTPGIVISLTGYLLSEGNLNEKDAINYIGGNICRCTGYASVKRAVNIVLNTVLSSGKVKNLTINNLIRLNLIPEYFKSINGRLKKLTLNQPNENYILKAKTIIAGGTDLFVQKPDELLRPELGSISLVRDLKEIKIIDGEITLGAGVTVDEFQRSKIINNYLPGISTQLNLFGSAQIRNKATIGGNIINASPIGDITNILISLNALLHVYNGKENRIIPLRNFYRGYKLLKIKNSEILKYVSIPIRQGNFKFNFEKISRRTYLDIASVNSSIYIKTGKKFIEEVGISSGGVAPFPLFLKQTCKYLVGKEINSKNVLKAAANAQTEISPISDVRGSAEYKSLLLHQLILAHFVKLFPSQLILEELV
jgi:xanthine dehydrogenase small subunit